MAGPMRSNMPSATLEGAPTDGSCLGTGIVWKDRFLVFFLQVFYTFRVRPIFCIYSIVYRVQCLEMITDMITALEFPRDLL